MSIVPFKSRGARMIAFMERYLHVPEGTGVGQPLRLDPFQKSFIFDVYDNPFVTTAAYLSLARKNGKTALIAAILLGHLAGPEAIENTQIVSGAMSRDQAAVVFELARKMVNFSTELRARVRIFPSGKRLLGLSKNVEYRALAAEGKTAHGLSPVLAVLDEVGQIEAPTSAFVEAIVTAQGAHANPLLIVISTQAAEDGAMFSLWLDSQAQDPDPKVISHVYSAPDDCALDDEDAWRQANPALGTFRSIDDMRNLCRRAMKMPANEPSFRNLNLNQRAEAGAPFVARSVWEANGAPPNALDKQKVWGGLDLSSVADLTALVLVSDEGDVWPTFWLPGEGIDQKSTADSVPYNVWAKQGFLELIPGKAIEYRYVAGHLREIFDRFNIQSLAFDRALFAHLRPWLMQVGFTEPELDKFVQFGQGTLSMTPALRELEAMLLTTKLKHGKHPVLNMCAANAKVQGNSTARKFEKKIARKRIDGMVALAMAVGVMPADVEPVGDMDGFFKQPVMTA
jgi:phage terminase large subunit-like protein